jgi:hypothetical protein
MDNQLKKWGEEFTYSSKEKNDRDLVWKKIAPRIKSKNVIKPAFADYKTLAVVVVVYAAILAAYIVICNTGILNFA